VRNYCGSPMRAGSAAAPLVTDNMHWWEQHTPITRAASHRTVNQSEESSVCPAADSCAVCDTLQRGADARLPA
jgi:hypothetical protein